MVQSGVARFQSVSIRLDFGRHRISNCKISVCQSETKIPVPSVGSSNRFRRAISFKNLNQIFDIQLSSEAGLTAFQSSEEGEPLFVKTGHLA